MGTQTTRRIIAAGACAAALLAVFAVAACEPGAPSSAPKVPAGDSAAPEAAATNSGNGGGAVLATYEGRKFTESDFRAVAARLNPRSRKTLENEDRRRALIENHILSELILERGRKQGLDKDPEIRAQIADLERQLIVQRVMQEYQSVPVSDAEVRKYYDDNIDAFTTDRVKASHILVADEETANKIRAELEKDPSKFAELAKEHSTDRSNAARGGDLGFFGKGRMVKEFEDAAFALTEDGQISQPVKTRFGFHIIMRTGREDGHQKPFEEVENQIRAKLVNEARTKKTEEFLDQLRREAGLEIDEAAIAKLTVPGKRDDDREATTQ